MLGGLELADETDLGNEILIESLPDSRLCVGDDSSHICSRRFAQVHDDVGVDVRDLRVANTKPLQSALIDQTPGTYAFDLPEDAAGAGMIFEPGMPRSAPGKVLLHDAM
ncbi:MAG: hypothetical protein MNPFHGCM_00100 [Gemmatimonadaceae bacterium]|nr:hypothetical protein [Gemmatimonadaceae bacterium]